jgi:hypothetical protein
MGSGRRGFMPMPADLVGAINAYEDRKVSLDQFENLFRDYAYGMFAEAADIRAAIVAIDSAFSELRSGFLNEQEFREELVATIRPFGVVCVHVFGEPRKKEPAMEFSFSTRPREFQTAYASL